MNKWIGIGRLTADPTLNFAAGTGTAVCRFSLAVTRPFKKDETDFINCIAFGKTGETIAQYLTKGRQVAIAGRIQTGSYDAKDGTKRYTTDVVVESFEFIGNSNGSSNNQGGPSNNEFNQGGFYDDMTPEYTEDCPF
ncbi:single-stranded DNA-binding protein [Clostridium nigeriense]|uniref:single-stranded DNA-binding protein n=1 Tax=Clostridium nigeriense TaxID=1805470 RepID=UPI003D32DEC6